MKLAKNLERLGTETAFAVSAEANSWAKEGNKIYPFHLGDINIQTPLFIREATNRHMNEKKNDTEVDSQKISDICSTHPHNFYLEILTELGIFGLNM